MSQIDRVGPFIATIQEAAYGETKKGLPQFVAKFLATKRYVTDTQELEDLKLPEEGWTDWNYGDEITGFFCLFNHDGSENFNFKQIQIATGWSGNDFQELSTLVGKSVLIRVEENTYEGKTSLQVSWIDAPDASPLRGIKQADASTVAAANSKWLKGRSAPVKPVTAAKPTLPKTATPAATTPVPSAVASVPVAAPLVPAATPVPAAKGPPKNRTRKADPEPAVTETKGQELTQAEAWDAIFAPDVKKTLDDSTIEDLWIAKTTEVAPGVADADVTKAQWAQVKDAVLAAIAKLLA